MARKTDASIINNALNLIRSGESVVSVSRNLGVSQSVIKRAIKKFGVKTSDALKKERLDNLSKDMVSMYQDGESENAVAKHFGVSRNVVRRYIEKFGIKPRTQSEAEALKWSKMSEEQRNRQVQSAHEANKGTPKSYAAKVSLAKARERIKYDHLIGVGEFEFIQLLNDRGIDCVHQKAVKFYNIDIAIGNVAVELTLGGTRYTQFNPKEIKRAKNLLECGYHTLAVQFSSEEALINCADDIIRAIDEISRLETFISEYWVISCRSQNYTISKNKLGQFTSEPAPIHYITKRSVIQL